MEEEIKKIIEENPIAFGTIDAEGNPYVIAVAYVKVKDNQIIITNNYMKTTINNIKQNPEVCLAFWNQEFEGYQIKGTAEHFEEGKWLEFVKSLKENKNYPAKGAIIIKIKFIKKLS